MLEFEPEEHVYKADGKVVPSVTQVLTPINGYDGIPEHVLNHAAERGTEIHHICELYDYGTLGEFNEEYRPYLDAWEAFLLSTGWEVELVEHRLYHDKIGYAGTIDRILRNKKRRILGDIKSTYTHVPSVGPQTAAYMQLFNHNYPDDKITDRYSIRLKADGSFVLHKCTDRSDLTIFQSCLNIHNWKARN